MKVLSVQWESACLICAISYSVMVHPRNEAQQIEQVISALQERVQQLELETKQLREKIAILTRGPESRGGASTEPAPTAGSQLAKIEGLLIKLEECRITGNGVACSMQITSLDQEGRIQIVSNNRGSRLTIQGKQYPAKSVRIGSNESKGGVSETLAPDTPTNTTMYYEAVPSKVREIGLMEFIVLANGRTATVRFRDVPLRY